MIEDKLVAHMQDAILRSVFRAELLPGGRFEVRLPDRAFVLRHQDIYLLDKGLLASVDIEHAGKTVRVISQQDLDAMLKSLPDVAFLQFRPATTEGDSVIVSLKASLATQDTVQGLSAIQIEFLQVDGQWSVVNHPVAFAD